MLTGYDEWICDRCNQQFSWAEMVFQCGREVCDCCHELETSGNADD